jgi:hypothetical protein
MAIFAACWVMESRRLSFYRDQNAFLRAFFPVAETALVYIQQEFSGNQRYIFLN